MLLYQNIYTMPYVHGKEEDVRYHAINMALLNKKNQSTINLLGRYMNKLASQFHFTNATTGEIISPDTLGPQTLVSLMDQIAASANEAVQDQLPQASSTILNAIDGVSSNTDFYKNGRINTSKFHNMIDSLLTAVEIITNTVISENNRIAFETIYRKMFNRRLSQSRLGNDMTALVNSWNIQQGAEVINQVITSLRNIPQNIIDSNGNVTSSIKGSMDYIMKTQIGGALGEIFYDIGLKVNNVVQETMSQEPKILKRGFVGGRADIYDNHGLQITTSLIQPGENQYVIEGTLNSTVKWYSSKTQRAATINPFSKNIQIAEHNSLIRWIEQVYGTSPSSMYGVYNTLAWRNTGASKENYQILKTSALQTSLDLFISGNNESLFGMPGFDTSAFLIINGEFYSVAGILAIVEQQLNSTRENDIVVMNLKGTSQADKANEWLGERSEKNIALALKRNAAAKKALNNIGFNVKLNGPALFRTLSSPTYSPAKLTIP